MWFFVGFVPPLLVAGPVAVRVIICDCGEVWPRSFVGKFLDGGGRSLETLSWL